MWSTTGMAWVLCLDFGIVLIAPDVEFGALVNNLGDSAEYFRAMAIIAALLTMPAGLTGVAMRWAMRPDAEESRSSTPGE